MAEIKCICFLFQALFMAFLKIWNNWNAKDPENPPECDPNQAIVLFVSMVGEIIVIIRLVSFRLF